MQKPRDRGDYGITPTDAEKSRLAGGEPGSDTPPADKKQEVGDDGDAQAGAIPADQQDAAHRTHTPYQEGGLG